jgi:hypothetical protein
VSADTQFVRFVAGRYHRLHGYGTVAVAVAVIAAAPLWLRAWAPREWWTLGGIAAALLVAVVVISRYYAREFGRATSAHPQREPWYAAIGIAVVESGVRRIGGGALESGLVAVALAGVFAFYAWREWPFRKLAGLPAIASLYIGIDRLTVSAGEDLQVWLMRTTILFAASLLIVGLADHHLIVRALSPAHRALALSAMPSPSGALPRPAADPIGATMVTALHECEAADAIFLGNLAGIRREQAEARLEELQQAGQVRLEPRGRGPWQTTMAVLTPSGHDIAREIMVCGADQSVI